jgi:hypothetical protein
MSPITIVIWATSIAVAIGIGAAIWTEPEFSAHFWFWFPPLGAIAWIFIAAAIGFPAIAFLKLRERSKTAYVAAVLLVGVVLGGGIGAANAALLGGAIFGGLLYGTTALAIVIASNMEANPTVDTDARESGARGSP